MGITRRGVMTAVFLHVQTLGLAVLIVTVAMATAPRALGAKVTIENDYVDQSGVGQMITVHCKDSLYDSGSQVLNYNQVWELDVDEVQQGSNPLFCIFNLPSPPRCADFFAWYNDPTRPSRCGVALGSYIDCEWHVNVVGFDLFDNKAVHTWAPCSL